MVRSQAALEALHAPLKMDRVTIREKRLSGAVAVLLSSVPDAKQLAPQLTIDVHLKASLNRACGGTVGSDGAVCAFPFT